MPDIEFEERPAPAGLEHVVAGMWFVRAPAPTPFERILPSPDVPLVVPLTVQPYRVYEGGEWRVVGGAFVAGLRQDAAISSNGAVLGNVGATVRPDALRAIGLDPDALAGGVRDVAGFGEVERLPADVAPDVALDALTRVLRARVDASWGPDEVVRATIQRFGESPQPRVADVARGLGVSHPGLVSRFRRSTGITPKAYADLARLHGLLELLTAAALAAAARGTAAPEATVVWSDLAAEAGYYDQSHLTRAFHRFVGLTPTAYFDRVRGKGPDAVRFVPEGEAPAG